MHARLVVDQKSTQTVSMLDVEITLNRLLETCSYNCSTSSNATCSIMNICKITPDDSMVYEILYIVDALRLKVTCPMTKSTSVQVTGQIRNTARLLDICNLCNNEQVMSNVRELIDETVMSQYLPSRVRHRTALEVVLRCRSKVNDKLIGQSCYHRRARMDLPNCPGLFMFSNRTPCNPCYRHLLLEFGKKQTDLHTFLSHLGRDVVLERINIKRRSWIPEGNFLYSNREYLRWPFHTIRKALNDRDFLMSCFSISEEIYTATCLDRCVLGKSDFSWVYFISEFCKGIFFLIPPHLG